MKVLFGSKNNKAVDVVEARVNGLGNRPVLLRLGSKEYQAKLADYPPPPRHPHRVPAHRAGLPARRQGELPAISLWPSLYATCPAVAKLRS